MADKKANITMKNIMERMTEEMDG
jgi:hypothetical protein